MPCPLRFLRAPFHHQRSADDCKHDEVVKVGYTSKMQKVLNVTKTSAGRNKMVLDVKKRKDMWIRFRECISELDMLIED